MILAYIAISQQGNRRNAMAPPCKFNAERDALLKQGYAENTPTTVILERINATLDKGECVISIGMLGHRARWFHLHRSPEYRSWASQQQRYRSRPPMPKCESHGGDIFRQAPLPPLQSLHAVRGGG